MLVAGIERWEMVQRQEVMEVRTLCGKGGQCVKNVCGESTNIEGRLMLLLAGIERLEMVQRQEGK